MIETLPPLSLYVHLPWCVRKCPYCDFNSHELTPDGKQQNQYVEALIRDLHFSRPEIENRSINSIFFGGGTPSLFSSAAIETILREVDDIAGSDSQREVTLEANPGTAEVSRFQAYREAGVNRLSIGVQSFQGEALKRLGRIHDGKEADAAINMARQAGFDNINVDLMFGLPAQSIEEALNDLRSAFEKTPTHISWYQLTLEPNTVFYKYPPALPEDDMIWDMQTEGQRLLNAAGYQQYEISAYSQGTKQCRHNLNYWQFGDYLGIGAGAHSKLTEPDTGVISRFAKHRMPLAFIEKAGQSQVLIDQKQLFEADIRLEFMMNVLRLTQGFTPELFEERTGLIFSQLKEFLDLAIEQNLLSDNGNVISPTSRGKNYLNELLSIFM